MIQAKPFLSIRDCSAVTGLSQSFLRKGCQSGAIPCVMVGSKYMIVLSELLRLYKADPIDGLVGVVGGD